MAQLWNADVANAVAHRLSMPGVDRLQRQFVRYQGQIAAAQTQQGWTRPESDAAMQQVLSDPLTPLQPPLTASLPQQMQLSIKSAPADFCLPIKKLKRFKPSFKVELRVLHSSAVHLPVRVKAFVVHKWQMDSVHEWLPEELQDDEDLKHTKSSDKKGRLQDGRVLSCLFTDTPPRPPRRRSHGGAAGGRARPAFPARASLDAAAPDPRPRLSSDASLVCEADDPPDDAAVLHVTSGTILAEFDFAALKFDEPTNMKPVYIAFACLVGNRDLLYTVYSVPCIAVCRAEQREDARRRLGLPATVWADLGVARPAVITKKPQRPSPAPLSARRRSQTDSEEHAPSMQELWDDFARQLPAQPGPADGHAEANTHPPRTGQVITPIAMNPQQPPTLMGGAGAAVDAQAQPCLFSSATLDAVLRSGPTAATGAPSAQQSSFENFWSLLQQRDASLEDLVHGPRAGGMSSQAMQLDGDYGFQYAPPPRADRAAQAIDALTHSGFACGAETRQGGELYGFEEMRRERSREAITNSHTQR